MKASQRLCPWRLLDCVIRLLRGKLPGHFAWRDNIGSPSIYRRVCRAGHLLQLLSYILKLGRGSLVASTLVKVFGYLPDSRAYRGPFALQWLFPTFLLLGLPFCPESPWWLVRKGNTQGAARSLGRLGYKDVDASLESIRRTVYVELVDQMKTSYLDCFRGVDLRRTEIGIYWILEHR